MDATVGLTSRGGENPARKIMRKLNPKETGIESEMAIIRDLIFKRYIVSLPYGDNAPYDLIAQKGNKLIRIQCRTARSLNGAMAFKTCNTRTNLNGWVTKKSKGFDWFGVYNKEYDKCLYVKRGNRHKFSMSIRIEQSKSNKKKNINFVKDFISGPK